jgi:hypothetical protein
MSPSIGLTKAHSAPAEITQSYFQCLQALTRTGSDTLALPFDIAREQYAKSVRLGLIERSLLASAQFGRTLNAMEKLTLGPFARS